MPVIYKPAQKLQIASREVVSANTASQIKNSDMQGIIYQSKVTYLEAHEHDTIHFTHCPCSLWRLM